MGLRGRTKYLSRLVVGLAVGWFLAGFAVWADSVNAVNSGGYGRIVLTLSNGHAQAKVIGSVLTISFPQRTNITPAQVVAALPGYITSGRIDADGKTLRFALNQSARLHISSQGARTAVDLLPDGFKGNPPPLAPDKKPAGPPPPVDMNNLEGLKVRSGAYQNFSRIVFDWPRNVPYSVSAARGRISVRFGVPVKPDFSAIERQLPPWVKPAGWHIEGRSTVVDLTTDSDSGYHDFRDGTHVVVDVLAPRTDAQAYHPPGDAHPTVTAMRGEGVATPQKPAKTDRFVETGKPAGVSDAQAAAISDTAGRLNHPPVQAPQVLSATVPSAPTGGTQAITAKPSRGGITLTIPGAAGRSAAIFSRGTTAWIVLQSSPAFDITAIKAPMSAVADAVETVAGSGVSVIRILLKRPMPMAASIEGGGIVVVLAPQITNSASNLRFVRDQDDAAHATLTTSLPGAGKVVLLNDPSVKDRLMVVPGALGQAVISERHFVEFSLLPTAAGIAVAPQADDISVTTAEQMVSISRTYGLVLSQNTGTGVDTAFKSTGDGADSFLDFARWGRPTAGSFLATERALRARAAKVGALSASAARIDLARFYLANDFGAEALGLLNMMQSGNAVMQNSTQLQLMRAAANYQMGRYRDAHNAIADAAFDSDRHAALWRGLIDEALENAISASANFERALPVLPLYRADIRAKVYLAATEAALALGHTDEAHRYLDRLPSELPGSLRLQADLLRARYYAALNDKRTSDQLFAAVERGPDPQAAAQAVYYRIDAGLQSGSIKTDEAINALERLRYRWRGDALELRTLSKLSQLYLKEKRWRDGLSVLNVVAKYFPGNAAANKADDQMRSIFADLYLKGRADSMPPPDALGLFYDYIDLTPLGPDGDEMIRRMADRLAGVDLLGPAADLLRYQIDKRLDGMARAQVAARLAAVQLMDHKPKDALDTLLSTQISAMPEDVAHQRLLLQARALADLKRWDEAIDLIDVDKSPDTARYRADIYWRSGNWAVAGQKAEALLANRWNDANPLSDDERMLVMHAAVAYALSSDGASVDRVRARYANKMKDTPDAQAFAVVTSRDDIHGMAFRDAAAKIASVDMLRSFVKDMEKKR